MSGRCEDRGKRRSIKRKVSAVEQQSASDKEKRACKDARDGE